MDEAKIFKEYLKGDIDNFKEFKLLKWNEMVSNFYMCLRR